MSGVIAQIFTRNHHMHLNSLTTKRFESQHSSNGSKALHNHEQNKHQHTCKKNRRQKILCRRINDQVKTVRWRTNEMSVLIHAITGFSLVLMVFFFNFNFMYVHITSIFRPYIFLALHWKQLAAMASEHCNSFCSSIHYTGNTHKYTQITEVFCLTLTQSETWHIFCYIPRSFFIISP